MFAKAPIKRFNDTNDQNPAPGAYNPKYNTDVADYCKGPDFERQIITSTHGFATGGSRSGSRDASRSGSRSGSQKGSRRATPSTSEVKVVNSSLESKVSGRMAQKARVVRSLLSQPKFNLVHKTAGDCVLKEHVEPSPRLKLRSDPHHHVVHQVTTSTNTDLMITPPPTSDPSQAPEGLQTRIETLERRLSLETEKFSQLKEQSAEYKNELDRMQQHETTMPKTSSACTCTETDIAREVSSLQASHSKLSEHVDQLVSENKELQAQRDMYRTQLDAKLSLEEPNTDKDEIKFLQAKLADTELDLQMAEEKCQLIIKELDECNRTILENSPAAREPLFLQEIGKLKEELERERERNLELNIKCEYLDKLCIASRDAWQKKEGELHLKLKQREDEIARLTTALGGVAVSAKNVEEKACNKSKDKKDFTGADEQIPLDINGNIICSSLDSKTSKVFSPPYELQLEEVIQVSPTLFVSSVGKQKSRTNLLNPFQVEMLAKESSLVREREAIKKEMRSLTSGKCTVQNKMSKLDAENLAALRECERLKSENERLKELLLHNPIKNDVTNSTLGEMIEDTKATPVNSDCGIRFIKRKKIVPGNSVELDVDPYEFRRTDLLREGFSSVDEIPFLNPGDESSLDEIPTELDS